MADRGREEDCNSRKNHLKNKSESEEDGRRTVQNEDRTSDKEQTVNDQASGNTMKQAENPFSFRHFLNKEVTSPYANTGARPKTYKNDLEDNHQVREPVPPPIREPPPVREPPPPLCSNTNTNNNTSRRPQRMSATPDFASALPDFVQDHLIIEQNMHQNGSSPRSCSIDLENLPDFAIINGTENNSYDLPDGNSQSNDSHNSAPINLSNFDAVNHRDNIPLDLPVNFSNHDQNDPASDILGPQRLPDFLSDGPLQSGHHHNDNSPGNQGGDQEDFVPNHHNDYLSEMQVLREENLSLRRQLEEERRLYQAECRKVERLERRVAKESTDTSAMENLIEKVEENLRNTTTRAIEAETVVSKQSKEIKELQMQLSMLRIENDDLHQGLSQKHPQDETFNMHIVHEIRSAAEGAEHSLKQLLQGVDNLKMVASTLESAHKFKENRDHHKHS